MRRCRRCAGPLTFAGVQSDGSQVFACATTLYRTEEGRNIAVPCAPPFEFLDAVGSRLLQVRWATRKKSGDVTISTRKQSEYQPDYIIVTENPHAPAARLLATMRAKMREQEEVRRNAFLSRERARQERQAAMLRNRV